MKLERFKIDKIIYGITWLRGYTTKFAVADCIAGITVGLTVLPQSLAYATLAGLEPQYGLYSAFMGGIVYALLGGCREVTIGPTALLALMTSRHTNLGGTSGPALAILLCFLSGIVELLMACLKLGALVDLISLPVTVGFTSATALIICCSQLKGLIGVKGGSQDSFILNILSFFTSLPKSRPGDTVLGLTCIALLLFLRKLKDFKFISKSESKNLKLFIWVLSTSRNALIVLMSSLLAFYFDTKNERPFILTGTVRSGLPSFQLPPFSTTVKFENGTIVEKKFMDMVSELGPSIGLVPIIAVLGNVAISKAFGGSGINASRELVALSFSNICGSFFSSMPVTGSFSRSAVNHASGVKTPIGGIYTSALVLLALGVLTPYFQYIPRAALSAVIISAVIFMIEYEVVQPLWRCSRRELLPGAVTFILSLFVGVEIGLLAGVATDVAFLVHRAARPVLSVDFAESETGLKYLSVVPRHSLIYFPAIDWLRSGIGKALKENGNFPVVLDCRNLHEFDFTAARGLGALQKDLSEKKILLILLGPPEKIQSLITGAVSVDIPVAQNELHLDELLRESIKPLLYTSDLRDVITPLIENNRCNT